MKKIPNKLSLILLLSIAILVSTSCKKEDDNEKASNDIHGTWTMGQSTVDLAVEGVDLVDYMVANFEYTQEAAQTMVNFFTAAMQNGNQGTITFNEDGSYKFINPEGTENGTWSIGNDGNTLTLVYENETDNLSLISLSSNSMKLGVPTETEMIDLDGDDVDETNLSISMELNLSK